MSTTAVEMVPISSWLGMRSATSSAAARSMCSSLTAACSTRLMGFMRWSTMRYTQSVRKAMLARQIIISSSVIVRAEAIISEELSASTKSQPRPLR